MDAQVRATAREFDQATVLARRDLYVFVSIVGMPSDDSAVQALAQPEFQRCVHAAADLVRCDPSFHPARLGPGEVHPSLIPCDTLFESVTASPNEYSSLFGPGPAADCTPYETEYCPSRDVTYRSQQMADVAGYYRAFGLKRSDSAKERLDHVSLEAEFMSVLISREMYAVTEGLGQERIQVCREAQETFFRDHLGWWLPAFGATLERQSRSPFYALFGSFLRGFAAAERAVLGLEPFEELVRPLQDESSAGVDDTCCQPSYVPLMEPPEK